MSLSYTSEPYLCVMNMKNICVFVLLFLVSLGSAEVDDATLPHWQDLECEVKFDMKQS